MVSCNMNHEPLRQSKRHALSCVNLCSEDSAGQAVAWCQTLGLCSGPLAVHALTQCMVEDSPCTDQLCLEGLMTTGHVGVLLYFTTHMPDTFYISCPIELRLCCSYYHCHCRYKWNYETYHRKCHYHPAPTDTLNIPPFQLLPLLPGIDLRCDLC